MLWERCSPTMKGADQAAAIRPKADAPIELAPVTFRPSFTSLIWRLTPKCIQSARPGDIALGGRESEANDDAYGTGHGRRAFLNLVC